MALSAPTLKTDIETELTSLGLDLEAGQAGLMADAVSKAVVRHIQNNATVTTTVTGTSSDGATVTGTGTGSVG